MPASTAPIRVAIVDEERMMLDALKDALLARSEDMQAVVTVRSWAELFSHPAFPVDVVLACMDCGSDETMSDSIDAAVHRGSAVLVFARHPIPRLLRAALPAGANGFVATSEPMESVLTAIRSIAAGSSHLSTDVTDMLAREVVPRLSAQERRVLKTYAGGATVPQVAERLNISVETTKSYLKRIREKYRAVGINVGTKVALHRQAVSEGILGESSVTPPTGIERATPAASLRGWRESSSR